MQEQNSAVSVKTEFESSSSSPNQDNILHWFKVEVKDEVEHTFDPDCGCPECVVKREMDLGRFGLVKNEVQLPPNKAANWVKAEVPDEDEHTFDQDCGCPECLVKRELELDEVDNDRSAKRLRTDKNDGTLQKDDQVIVNQVNVIREDSAETNVVQLQVDIDSAAKIEVQHEQLQDRHLSDINYELEMLRNVFMKPLGNGDHFWCNYPQCGKQFGLYEQQQLTHFKLHTKPCVCDAFGCLRRFTSYSACNAHKRSHTENVLQCELPSCEKRFKNIGTLNLHVRDHSDLDVFICEWRDCDRVLSSVAGYRKHLLTHSDDGIGEQQLVCDWAGCTRKFTTQFNLAIHRQWHSGESHSQVHSYHQDNPMFSYVQCNAHSVCIHNTAHGRKDAFGCTMPGCGQAFASLGQLKEYVLVHATERPFVCGLQGCTKAFKSRAGLTQHQNSKQHQNR